MPHYVSVIDQPAQPWRTYPVPDGEDPREYASRLCDSGYIGGVVRLYDADPSEHQLDPVEVYRRGGRVGRPPLGVDVVGLTIRLPRGTRDTYTAAAEERGLSLSEWVRDVLDRSARRILG